MRIEGRTFIVSGGASGLGQACVDHIVEKGGHVAVLDISQDAGAVLVDKLGSQTRFFPCDVTQTESVTEAVNGAAKWTASTKMPLGGVVAAAGVGGPATILDKHGAPFDLNLVDWVLNVNLRGTIDLVRQSVAQLAKVEPVEPDGERGIVIMVASSAAFDGQKGQVSYAASKGAITAMTLPMTRDLARFGIRVATIAPSLFESAMTSRMTGKVRASSESAMEFPKRAGQPDEFAAVAVHLIENIMLNGTVIRLDGGMRMPSKM